MEINALIIRSIEAQANSLLDLAHRDSNDYQRAVELILGMSGKLVFTGMGKSGIIARKLAATFSSTGVPSFFVHPGEAYHGDLGMIEANDVLFALSNSGETPELLNLLKFSRSKKVIGVSHSNDSSLASFATVHLECKVDKEVCPLNLAPTTSTTAALVMGDAICAALMELKKFSKDVITDGDIRRAMATTENHHALFARDMGSKTPIFIDENMGLSEMDRLFRERKIVTVLVGSPQQLKGVVQFYDIHG
jgi:arabinose-5-phosphate isomerase